MKQPWGKYHVSDWQKYPFYTPSVSLERFCLTFCAVFKGSTVKENDPSGVSGSTLAEFQKQPDKLGRVNIKVV